MRANKWLEEELGLPPNPNDLLEEEIAEAEAQAGLALVIGLLIIVVIVISRMLGL
jgi:hypothetical protein